jgi:hypothetical protein
MTAYTGYESLDTELLSLESWAPASLLHILRLCLLSRCAAMGRHGLFSLPFAAPRNDEHDIFYTVDTTFASSAAFYKDFASEIPRPYTRTFRLDLPFFFEGIGHLPDGFN